MSVRVCSIEGCGIRIYGRGWCSKHYQRWRAHGSPHVAQYRRYGDDRVCDIEGCGNPHEGHGWCRLHYKKWQRHGDPLGESPPPNSLPARSIAAVHQRLRTLWGPASAHPCIECEGSGQDWAYDGTDPAQQLGNRSGSWCWWSPWPEFYMPMCKKCHGRRDSSSAKQELLEYRQWKLRNPGMPLPERPLEMHLVAG